MADIRIQEHGFERDEVYNRYDEKIGVAVYDLDDASVRGNLIALKDELKALGEKYEALALELKKDTSVDEDGFPNNAKPLAELNLQCVNEMIAIIDGVFGDDFCVRAVGNTKNPSVIWEVIAAVMENYGVKAKEEMLKFTNRANRRAGTKRK